MIGDLPGNSQFEQPPLVNSIEEDQEFQYMEEAAMPYSTDIEDESMPESEIVRVKQANEQRLLSIDGVVGVAIESNVIGDDEIVVFLRDATAQKRIPRQIEGFPVRTEITGEFEAY